MLETSTQEVILLEFLLRRALLVITCIEWSLLSLSNGELLRLEICYLIEASGLRVRSSKTV